MRKREADDVAAGAMATGVPRRPSRRLWLRVVAAVALIGPAAVASAPPVAAAQAEIASAGPLTRIITTDQLNCQVARAGELSFQFFGPNNEVGSCGTLVAVGGILYGPPALTSGPLPTLFTPISQTGPTGNGSASNPLRLTTVVGLGATGLRLTQTDSYVLGRDSYRTDIQLSSTGAATDVVIYRAGDCFLQGTDFGFGAVDAGRRAVACSANPNNSPPGRILQWLPLSGGSNYYQAGFAEVWSRIGLRTALPDTCECDQRQDNGAGISWTASVPAGGSVTRSHLLTFSPLGQTPGGTADQRRVGDRLKYAALGDSFASGEGNTPYAASGAEGTICHRSDPRPSGLLDRARRVRRSGTDQGSYPNALPGELLRLAPRSASRGLRVVAENHACTGAEVADLLNRQHSTVAPQVDRLEDHTDLMTVSVGGNDAGYSGALALCFIRADCFGPVLVSEVVACEALVRTGVVRIAPYRCNDDLGAAARRRIDSLNPGSTSNGPLDRAYDAIGDELRRVGSRQAQRFVVGYPELFPSPSEITTTQANDCRSVQVRSGSRSGLLSRGEMDDLNRLTGLLNRALESAASENGMIYVDVADALDGHELCTPAPWVRGTDGTRPLDGAFHPTRSGQQSLGKTAAASIFGFLDFDRSRGGGSHGEG
ncbi:MAG: SGNH/GDSL hydrolase family protein [Acidimicrobiales bacterium]